MIQLHKATLQLGKKVLLENADILFKPQQKIGIVGPNGAGKTSLFNLLLGKLQLEQGECLIPKNLSFAHIKQEMPNTEETAISFALQGDTELSNLLVKLKIAEEKEDGYAIADLHTQLEQIDGYAAESRAAKILLGLGFQQQQLYLPVNSFSGGWRMRLNLAQVLLARADVLLLDEPTNHLDLEGIIWLEKWLQTLPNTILLISHDREFLDSVTTQIVHLNDCKLTLYAGNYSSFEKTYAEQLVLQQATFVKQQKQAAHLQKFVDRFRYKASKAKQAQSRIKMLERMTMVEAVHAKNPFHFNFKEAVKGGHPMLRFADASVGYGTSVILKHILFSISDGDRIGLLGLNGAGKSTFIKLLASELQPIRGEKEASKKLKIGYFAQHQLEQLDLNESPLQHLIDLDPTVTENRARTFFGSFNFSGERVFEAIRHFSGGEKARLVLALIVWQEPNLLLLDEPTNHLDMEMREALNMALQNYNGGLVLVSHDRYLLKSLVDEFYLIHDSRVEKFAGDIEDYQRWVFDQNKEVTPAKKNNPPLQKNKPSNLSIETQISKLEKELNQQQAILAQLDERMSHADFYRVHHQEEIQLLINQRQQCQEKINALEEKILQLMEP